MVVGVGVVVGLLRGDFGVGVWDCCVVGVFLLLFCGGGVAVFVSGSGCGVSVFSRFGCFGVLGVFGAWFA